MNKEQFIKLHQEAGLNLYKIGDHYFYKQGLIQYSFPLLSQINVEDNVPGLIRNKGFISLILTDLHRKNTHEFILNTSDYGMDHFSKKIRNRIRKSLTNCIFKRPNLEDLLTYGLQINIQTMKRQHRKDKTLTESVRWTRYISAFYTNPGILVLGAYYEGRMVGYIMATELEYKHIILHAFIDRKDSETTDPMNGLIYVLVNQLLEEHKPLKITYGLDSFAPLSELNRFKINMLFERIPVSRVYAIHPLILPFIQILLFLYIRILHKKTVKPLFMRQIVRLYQGNRLFEKRRTVLEKKKIEPLNYSNK